MAQTASDTSQTKQRLVSVPERSTPWFDFFPLRVYIVCLRVRTVRLLVLLLIVVVAALPVGLGGWV